MALRNKKKKINKKVVTIIICVLLVFLFKAQVVSFGKMLSEQVFPLQSRIYIIQGKMKERYYEVFENKKISELNKEYRAKNLQLELLLNSYKSSVDENERLKKLLGLKQKNPNVKVATVNFKQVADLYKRFYIDLGSNDGIKKDMLAMAGSNLVGKVIEVYDDYSVVEMITDDEFVASATTDKGVLGLIKQSEDDFGKVEFIPSVVKDDVKKDDIITTSGISDIFPRGLYIGKISEEGSTDSKFTIDNGIDFAKITEVLIISMEEGSN